MTIAKIGVENLTKKKAMEFISNNNNKRESYNLNCCRLFKTKNKKKNKIIIE